MSIEVVIKPTGILHDIAQDRGIIRAAKINPRNATCQFPAFRHKIETGLHIVTPVVATLPGNRLEIIMALRFDRAATFGFRLDIPAGTAVRFEPGEEKDVTLVSFGGQRRVLGLNGLTEGDTRDAETQQRAFRIAEERGFLDKSWKVRDHT